MDIDAYCDGLIELFVSSGVERQKVEAQRTLLSHGYMKGVSFETAAQSLGRILGVPVETSKPRRGRRAGR
jgi:hypothetical protein